MYALVLLGVLSLLSPGFGSAGETETGCDKWIISGTTDVCCVSCKPGNRIVNRCGPDPRRLCTPCERGFYTEDTSRFQCRPCNKCFGPQILKKECASIRDTECDCKAGYRCGDDRCTHCTLECGKGEEPTQKRSCQTCPNGTFNDQIHQKCKPWKTRCPNPNEHIVAKGDAVSDIKCSSSSSNNHSAPVVVTLPTRKTEPGGGDGTFWAVFLACVVIVALVVICIVIISKYILLKVGKKKRPPKMQNVPIIRTPTTDEPQTLVDCSFQQPQQEQGSSTESLASQESKTRLLNV